MSSPTTNPKIRIIQSPQQPNQQPQFNIYSSGQNQQNSPYTPPLNSSQGKIKIKQVPVINQNRANEFENLFQKVQQDIQTNETQYNLSPYIVNDIVNYQFWKFEFCGQGNFQGRTISGLLKFQQDHPQSAPMFYFDPVQTKEGFEVIQHENVYGDHSLCIPLFTYWKKTTNEFEILQAIEHIFHHPNWQTQTDAPANPNFANLAAENKNQIQQEQALFLPEFQRAQ